MGVREMDRFLEQWQMDAKALRRRMILAPAPRERALRQAQGLARHLAAGPRLDSGSDGGGPGTGPTNNWPFDKLRRASAFGEGGPAALIFEQTGGSPPPALGETQQAELKAAVQELPEQADIELANWSLRQAQEEGGAAVCLGTV